MNTILFLSIALILAGTGIVGYLLGYAAGSLKECKRDFQTKPTESNAELDRLDGWGW